MKRRALLTAAAGGATLLAGCAAAQPPGTGDDDGGTGTNPDDQHDDNDDSTTDGEPTHMIETTWTDCGGPDDETVLAVASEDVIQIIGTTDAPNPCHEATLDAVSVDDEAVTIEIGVESTLGADEDCAQCHGAVGYEATIDYSPAAIESVIVDHSNGDRFEVPIRGSDEIPALDDIGIETTAAECANSDDEESVTVHREGDRIGITGSRPAPDPCHIATIEGTTIEDGMLSVVVDIAEEGEMCAQCIASIEYDLVVDLVGGSLIDEVRVEHVGAGTHTVSFDEAAEGA